MKNINDVAFIIQARVNSQRVPYKMVRKFGDTTLFDIGIQKLLSCSNVPNNNIILSIHDEELKTIGKKYGVQIFNRSYQSANNDNDLKTIYEWHNKIPYKYVIKLNPCSPFLEVKTIEKFVNTFINQDEENLFGVIKTKDYFWNKDGKLVTPWPEDQTIMNTKAVEITYKAGHVLYASRLDIIQDEMFMGNFTEENGIKLFPIDEYECFDIDYEWQFEMAESVYKKKNTLDQFSPIIKDHSKKVKISSGDPSRIEQNIKGKKVLMLGSGPSAREVDWKKYGYDVLVTTSFFYMNNEVVNSCPIHVTLSDIVDLTDARLLHYLDTNSMCTIGFEPKGHPFYNSKEYKEFCNRYSDRIIKYYIGGGKEGVGARTSWLVAEYNPSEIILCGIDGVSKDRKNDPPNYFRDHIGTADNYTYEDYLNDFRLYSEELNAVCNLKNIKLTNLGKGKPYNMLLGIK